MLTEMNTDQTIQEVKNPNAPKQQAGLPELSRH